jgi:hypothetical protein
MTVRCPDLETFARTCAAFVREGVTFDADAGALVIRLLGGF